MRCPKCGYNSFDYNIVCPKCKKDLAAVRNLLSLNSPAPKPINFFELLENRVSTGSNYFLEDLEFNNTEENSSEEIVADSTKIPEHSFSNDNIALVNLDSPNKDEPIIEAQLDDLVEPMIIEEQTNNAFELSENINTQSTTSSQNDFNEEELLIPSEIVLEENVQNEHPEQLEDLNNLPDELENSVIEADAMLVEPSEDYELQLEDSSQPDNEIYQQNIKDENNIVEVDGDIEPEAENFEEITPDLNIIKPENSQNQEEQIQKAQINAGNEILLTPELEISDEVNIQPDLDSEDALKAPSNAESQIEEIESEELVEPVYELGAESIEIPDIEDNAEENISISETTSPEKLVLSEDKDEEVPVYDPMAVVEMINQSEDNQINNPTQIEPPISDSPKEEVLSQIKTTLKETGDLNIQSGKEGETFMVSAVELDQIMNPDNLSADQTNATRQSYENTNSTKSLEDLAALLSDDIDLDDEDDDNLKP